MSVMVLARRQQRSDIPGFHGRITIAVHHGIGAVHVAFVIHQRSGGLVVHDEFDSLAAGMACYGVEVEIGIGR